jgi:hypothetical protein
MTYLLDSNVWVALLGEINRRSQHGSGQHRPPTCVSVR